MIEYFVISAIIAKFRFVKDPMDGVSKIHRLAITWFAELFVYGGIVSVPLYIFQLIFGGSVSPVIFLIFYITGVFLFVFFALDSSKLLITAFEQAPLQSCQFSKKKDFITAFVNEHKVATEYLRLYLIIHLIIFVIEVIYHFSFNVDIGNNLFHSLTVYTICCFIKHLIAYLITVHIFFDVLYRQ
jgi:hypothetical protein